ncbi:hypothetical protein Lalb_Chr15g0079151 [Lupinus albus]|uniref:Uncharacterized protein n=1 Tax=Lupinus albus TaxID=3870 RepID=A0A6A4P8M9_LUPAL|nr:hypothetical protein Lalb_Chr15g0079151 [Lupinus albus]
MFKKLTLGVSRSSPIFFLFVFSSTKHPTISFFSRIFISFHPVSHLFVSRRLRRDSFKY